MKYPNFGFDNLIEKPALFLLSK